MNSKELIAAGQLSEARAQLILEVKQAPNDPAKRTLLFQVLAFLGEWEKAELHLDLIAATNPKSEVGVQVYKNAVNAEKERKEVLQRKKVPGFVTMTPSYLDHYFAAWDRVVESKLDDACRLFDNIKAERPSVSGTVNGRAFDGWWDTDTFLSDFLEVIAHDRYLWIPFEAISEISIDPPKTLLELLWIPARLQTWEGLALSCYLPVVYPESCIHENDEVKMGKVTQWQHLGNRFSKGLGQHVFQVGEEEISLLDIRQAVFTLAS
jgi:type VI secretion system protein ImpE